MVLGTSDMMLSPRQDHTFPEHLRRVEVPLKRAKGMQRAVVSRGSSVDSSNFARRSIMSCRLQVSGIFTSILS
jgi:hypothetical protein